MTPDEARDSLTSIAVDTADLLEVDGWAQVGGASVQSCDGGRGVKWSYFYAAPLVDVDAAELTETVSDYWRSLGMDVRAGTGPVPSVFATGGPLQGMAFLVGPAKLALSGTSLCVPGDARKLRTSTSD